MQWSAAEGAGFSAGQPWIGINRNYRRINYEAQANEPGSILSFYKELIALRAASETLKYGSFRPRYARGGLLVYDREGEDEVITVFLNFSKRPVRLGRLRELEAAQDGRVLISNTGRTKIESGLEPWEALVWARKKQEDYHGK
jgi:glycosidase